MNNLYGALCTDPAGLELRMMLGATTPVLTDQK